MKGKLKRIIGILLVVVMMIPAVQTSTVSAAVKPTLNKTSITLTSTGVTYQLKVKNQPANTTTSWSSSNKKVAVVNGLGTVIAQNKGTATITCLIKGKNKSYTKLTCKVTVKIAATKVTISNAKEVNNVHEMIIGETYDFNRQLTPKGSSDKTYWEIEHPDIATVDSAGVVKALKVGTTRLIARAGATKKAAYSDTNPVTDSVLIHVSEPSAKVESVIKTDDKTLTVKFTYPMVQADLLDAYGKLNESNITVNGIVVQNTKPADVGTLKGSLSADGKTLTITAANDWDGYYLIRIEKDAKTQAGVAFEGYDEELNFSDTLQGTIVSSTLDDTGMIMEVKFNRPVDISRIKAQTDDVALDNSVLNQTTKTALTSSSNYSLSKDKKTLYINLATIASVDYNKTFRLYVSEIYDTKGNPINPFVNEIYVSTDTKAKPNATLSYVERTGKNSLTAHFSKSIQYAGYMTVGNTTVTGVVNKDDKTCVTYTFPNLSTTSSYITGTISSWASYNTGSYGVAPSQTFTCDMSVGTAGPTLSEQPQFNTTQNSTGIVNSIVLTYDKKVTLVKASGTLSATFRDSSSNVIPQYLKYTASVQDNVVTLVIDPANTIATGTYQITIPGFFVQDTYMNYNEQITVTVGTNTGAGAQFPAPTSIEQDKYNPSVVYVKFGKKVDLTSAQTVTNYKLDQYHPYTAEVTSNSDAGSVVQLTFTSGLFAMSTDRPMYIENVKGYANSYGPMEKYRKNIYVAENKAPIYSKATLSGTTITLVFSENIKGTADFKVYSNGQSIPLNSATSCYISGNTVVIVLATTVSPYSTYVEPGQNCNITDMLGNKAVLPATMSITN